ncbi:hypothetical protein FF124_13065 [Martelella lutilitoris]|uniref:Uncharacterized protein n=1 Tax=Martelella lutilitoris TaxID=2583532 RepID=A0A5C4JP55_9HYPH|nr:hypothetical protein [Martelella lutilitoris]TNB47107.1 hypothetical protein FF124_13065 [Martelella lutilitoris]
MFKVEIACFLAAFAATGAWAQSQDAPPIEDKISEDCKSDFGGLPRPDCLSLLNEPSSSGGGAFMDKTINLNQSIYLGLPIEQLKAESGRQSILVAPDLAPAAQ